MQIYILSASLSFSFCFQCCDTALTHSAPDTGSELRLRSQELRPALWVAALQEMINMSHASETGREKWGKEEVGQCETVKQFSITACEVPANE